MYIWKRYRNIHKYRCKYESGYEYQWGRDRDIYIDLGLYLDLLHIHCITIF